MATDSEGKSRLAVNVSVGKEIDASLAEIITALLKPGATEVGNLLGDAFGLLSDRLRQKRVLNIQKGLVSVRKQLEHSAVDLESIEPPDEEDLYLLVDGLSLSGDEYVRELWAKLIAESLAPNSKKKATRPFIQILQNLTALDARIISFLALSVSQERALQEALASIEEAGADERVSDRAYQEACNNAERALEVEMQRYGLDSEPSPGWANNLVRLGLIERIPKGPLWFATSSLPLGSRSAGGIERTIRDLENHVSNLRFDAEQNLKPIQSMWVNDPSTVHPKLSVRLSPFGLQFARACALMQ